MQTSRVDDTVTWNGAVSLSTTGQARLDYFSKAIRDTPKSTIYEFLDRCWEESPIDTLRLIFYKRDCRGGAGERRVFYDSISWLIERHYVEFSINRKLIPEYGSWKDLLVIMDEHQDGLAFVALLNDFREQLQADLAKMESGSPVSLAGKWAPSEHKKYHHIARQLAHKMCDNAGVEMNYYRKNILSPLRAYINIVESLMCAKKWDQIDFSKVPSRAMMKLREAFQKHEPSRFEAWRKMVDSGEAKINVGLLDPPEIMRELLRNPDDAVMSTAWTSMMAKIKNESAVHGGTCVVCDVSGSMFSGCKGSIQPIHVSLAFGLIVAQLSQGRFHNKIITFDDSPSFFTIAGNTPKEQIKSLQSAPWGGSTNIQAVFDLLLNVATTFNLTTAELPSRIICISDMQFNVAGGNRVTNWEIIKQKYRNSGYAVPEFVFWNVSGVTSDFPVSYDESGVALVSGYNKSTLKSVMTGKIVSPYQIMREVIDSPRYEAVRHY